MDTNDKIEKIIKFIDKLKDGHRIGYVSNYVSGYNAALKDVKEFIENIYDDEVLLKEFSKELIKIAKENPVEIKISEEKDPSYEFDIDKSNNKK